MNGIVAMPTISASNVMVDGRPLTEVLAELAVPPRAVEPPTLSDTAPVYTGTVISLADHLAGYDPTAMTLTGVAAATDAGEYPAVIELLPRCTWPDGSTEPIPLTWTVVRAPGSIALSQTNVSVSNDAATVYVDVLRVGDGGISVSTSAPDIATGVVDGDRVAVTGLARGNATITITVAQSANYEEVAAELVVTSTVCSYDPATCTAQDVKDVFDAGTYEQIFAIGDTFPVKFNGTFTTHLNPTFNNVTIGARIIGFNHNAAYEGAKSIHFALGTIGGDDGALELIAAMNASGSCDGGWQGCDLRRDVVPNVLNAIEESWRNIISPCTKYTSNGHHTKNDTAAEVTATTDRLWLMSAFEIKGTDASTWYNPYEPAKQQQYEYYANGASAARKELYRTGKLFSGAVPYWCRNPVKYLSYASYQYFCYIQKSGDAGGKPPKSEDCYMVPCFALVA